VLLLQTLLVWLTLFGTGYAYDRWVDRRRRQGRSETEVHWWVVLGVGWTHLGILALYGWRVALGTLACFVCSGFWMIVGYQRNRRSKEQRGRELLDADPP